MNAVKKLISIFMLFGILSNCMNYWILSTFYTKNKSYISTVLCTNKNKPELHCEGKCFMDIKLKELEQKNKQQLQNFEKSAGTIAAAYISLLDPLFETTVKLFEPYYLQQSLIGKMNSIFQPPKII